ncbi:MAG: type II toxin-antitoxin system RelE/ParE family toxin [Spirochaetes bacterium]|nr:type II toxin-antitoxin system RelE/ParE family toxin [Spirochaetota bacterium]
MNIKFKQSFNKDIKKIKNKVLNKKIINIIQKIKQAGNIYQLRNIRNMEGFKDFYRIRTGEYRIGIKLENNSIILIKCLHRKDMYRSLP